MSSGGGLVYGRYRAGDRDEWMMRIGDVEAPPVLLLPPLFEEMNRTRAFLVSIMRSLAERGFGCWLPDLPATGESSLALEDCSWNGWREAARDAGAHVEQASGREVLVASFRGGALLDDAVAAACIWRLAPAEGASLARDLIRAGMLAPEELTSPKVDLAGYRLSDSLLAELRDARLAGHARVRTVRLESDRADADLKLAGPSLWRRSEPDNSLEMAAVSASDIADWYERCAVS